MPTSVLINFRCILLVVGLSYVTGKGFLQILRNIMSNLEQETVSNCSISPWQNISCHHEIVFKRITHKVCIFFWRVAFSWHPPVFFSSDFGHVTPPNFKET